MRMAADQCLLPFDAGYCAMHVWPVKAETTGKSSSTPRHPDAAAAILAHSSTLLSTGYFGGITKGPKGDAGLHSMPIEDLGLLYHKRTNLSSRTLKALSDTTDAPKRLNGVPSSPVHDEATLRANFPKLPAKADGTSQRSHVVAFDLEGPHPPSKHGDNRYALNFVYLNDEDGEIRRADWHLEYLRAKSDFPDVLATFVDTADLPWKKVQLYCDNEIVLTSKAVQKVLKSRGLKPLRAVAERLRRAPMALPGQRWTRLPLPRLRGVRRSR